MSADPDGGVAGVDAGPLRDGGATDAGAGVGGDAGIPQDGGSSAQDGGGSGQDGGSSAADGGGSAADGGRQTLATGNFEGRFGHSAAGGAAILREPSGGFAVVLSSDFSVTPGPGLRIVLASRDALGTAIDPAAGDVDLGLLPANTGAQTVVIPVDPQGRRRIFVYCRPFGIEFGRAVLGSVP